jgi:hypothetical protein
VPRVASASYPVLRVKFKTETLSRILIRPDSLRLSHEVAEKDGRLAASAVVSANPCPVHATLMTKLSAVSGVDKMVLAFYHGKYILICPKVCQTLNLSVSTMQLMQFQTDSQAIRWLHLGTLIELGHDHTTKSMYRGLWIIQSPV